MSGIEILRKNSAFWSKLGFCYDPPRLDSNGKPIVFFDDFSKFAGYHRDFAAAGVKIHTSILFNGWVGVNRYDYSLTDQVLDSLFKDNPDIYYIPRIKLNVPVEWCKNNPDDVCVYFDGPRETEAIRSLVGTEKHDILGYDSPKGYYTAGGWQDDRPNVGGVISNQSFSSEKWLADAGKTLVRLLEHLENGPYGKRIVGYHIAYGVSGETCMWGRFSGKFGDYGINNRRAFFDWGIKEYGSLKSLKEAWNEPEITRENTEPPPPRRRQRQAGNLRDFFRVDDCICVDYDRFISEVNAKAVEHFCSLVKEKTGKAAGCFYGYFLECFNAAYTGWLSYERLLNSPNVDFFAAPKSYYRSGPGEPGGELAPAQSVNRRKFWMDELDNRTHLCVTAEKQCENISETQTVMWREFAKNMAHGSGFWWMDLGGGWYDSPEVLREVAAIEKTAVNLRNKPEKSVAEILLVVDEESEYHHICNISFHSALMKDMVRNINLCGAPTDMYRLKDLENLDMAQYKLIIFLNTFKLSTDQWERIEACISKDATLLWNYAPGILNPEFSVSNIEAITGLKVQEKSGYPYPELFPEPGSVFEGAETLKPVAELSVDYPLLEIIPLEESQVLAKYDDNTAAIVSNLHKGRNIIYSVLPFLQPEHLHRIAASAGCHMYAPADCSVYGDSRFIGIFPRTELKDAKLVFREKVSFESTVSGRKERSVKSITMNLKAKEMEFFIYN